MSGRRERYENSRFLARSTAVRPASMEPLLDLLRDLHLTGGVFLDAEFTSPWCVRSSVGIDDCSAYFAETVARHRLPLRDRGRCVVEVAGLPAMEVKAGEIVLLPRNDPHRLGSALNVRAVNAGELIEPAPDGGLARYRLRGRRPHAHPVRVPRHEHGEPGRRPAVGADGYGQRGPVGARIESSFKFASQELVAGRARFTSVLARLAELLFIEAVRLHVASLPRDHRGWLAGLRDPIVGRALATAPRTHVEQGRSLTARVRRAHRGRPLPDRFTEPHGGIADALPRAAAPAGRGGAVARVHGIDRQRGVRCRLRVRGGVQPRVQAFESSQSPACVATRVAADPSDGAPPSRCATDLVLPLVPAQIVTSLQHVVSGFRAASFAPNAERRTLQRSGKRASALAGCGCHGGERILIRRGAVLTALKR